MAATLDLAPDSQAEEAANVELKKRISQKDFDATRATKLALEQELKALENLDKEQRNFATRIGRKIYEVLSGFFTEASHTADGAEYTTWTLENFEKFWFLIRRPKTGLSFLEIKWGENKDSLRVVLKINYPGIHIDLNSADTSFECLEWDIEAWRTDLEAALDNKDVIFKARQKADADRREAARKADKAQRDLETNHAQETAQCAEIVAKLEELRERRKKIGLMPTPKLVQANSKPETLPILRIEDGPAPEVQRVSA
ncbi:hypothetical protein KW785_01870 [Candidatus Parcubacteria bacterium]|nr:hypothetical protein [Candidatus Parcubacteria bacterium]